MGAHGATLMRVCVYCGARGLLSTVVARRAGWVLWPGGGCCSSCLNKKMTDPNPSPTIVERRTDPLYVCCASCGVVVESYLKFEDGWHPTFHWLTTEENKRALRERKIPIPMCPGMKLAGVRVEHQP